MAGGHRLAGLLANEAVEVSEDGDHDGEDQEVLGQVVEPVHREESEGLVEGRGVSELALRHGDENTVE